MVFSFKRFVEEKKPDKPLNHIDAMDQELGIDRASLPKDFSTGWLELPEEGLYFNQAIWQLLPVGEHDMFARIKYFRANSSNPNFVRCYTKGQDGKLQPYMGEIDGSVHLISIARLAKALGLPFQAAAGATGMGTGGMT